MRCESASGATDRDRDGVAVIDKPANWTSHDVIAKCRGIFGTRKVGHSGTLDPSATGVLVLGVGKATRLLRFLTELPKSYVGEIVMGIETSTLDADGEICARHDMSAVTDDQVRAVACGFVGAIKQVPPMVSALKVGGKRLYELAREGKEVERQARPVHVYRYDIEPLRGSPGVWRCSVDCSSGTYIRSLAADLGTALGGGAHLRSLRRVAVGGFTIDEATSVDAAILRPIADAVAHLKSCVVSNEIAVRVSHGQVLSRDALVSDESELGDHDDGPWAVFNPAGDLLAVYAAVNAAAYATADTPSARPQGFKPLVVIPA